MRKFHRKEISFDPTNPKNKDLIPLLEIYDRFYRLQLDMELFHSVLEELDQKGFLTSKGIVAKEKLYEEFLKDIDILYEAPYEEK